MTHKTPAPTPTGPPRPRHWWAMTVIAGTVMVGVFGILLALSDRQVAV